MEKGTISVISGNGRGKTSLAIGESLKASPQKKSVIIIQFLKGSERNELEFLEQLDQLDIKLFRFEKQAAGYEMLTDEEKHEERTNILNGVNFARKVIVTRECDFLVLDEILGLIEMDIVTQEAVTELLQAKDESMTILLTGRRVPEWLIPLTDSVTTLTTTDIDAYR